MKKILIILFSFFAFSTVICASELPTFTDSMYADLSNRGGNYVIVEDDTKTRCYITDAAINYVDGKTLYYSADYVYCDVYIVDGDTWVPLTTAGQPNFTVTFDVSVLGCSQDIYTKDGEVFFWQQMIPSPPTGNVTIVNNMTEFMHLIVSFIQTITLTALMVLSLLASAILLKRLLIYLKKL